MNNEISITATLTAAQALEFAQFLKRVRLDAYLEFAVGEEDAQRMLDAGEVIREALAVAGFKPR